MKAYLCTRPKLATTLIKAGEAVEQTVNPFANETDHRLAWSVTLTPNAAAIIKDYYIEIGKPVPHSVSSALDAMKGDAENA